MLQEDWLLSQSSIVKKENCLQVMRNFGEAIHLQFFDIFYPGITLLLVHEYSANRNTSMMLLPLYLSDLTFL